MTSKVVFGDLEAVSNPADAIAAIGIQAKSVRAVWNRIRTSFAKLMRSAGDRDQCGRNWSGGGDAILAALPDSGRRIVLATVELPTLVKRLLKDETGHVTPEGKRAAAGSSFPQGRQLRGRSALPGASFLQDRR
ncbi:MAG: hypothetical protein F4051_03240 [Boseongicola sp. SB0670_bin_30]|nr:hypothetical protein [Boseongicola sp. SB0670_bin_30]